MSNPPARRMATSGGETTSVICLGKTFPRRIARANFARSSALLKRPACPATHATAGRIVDHATKTVSRWGDARGAGILPASIGRDARSPPESGVLHPQRLEDVRACENVERLAGNALHDLAEERVVDVGVAE